MNKNILYIVGGLIIVLAIGAIIWLPKGMDQNQQQNETVVNNETSSQENNRAIVIEPEAKYFNEVKGYFVHPQAPGNYPGIVMIHENRGLRPEIKAAAEKLAKEGYMVLAVDILGGVVEDQTQAKVLTANFNQQTGIENMKSAVAYLKEQGATKVASWGWCFGGKQSVELAISGEKLDATVVYYGGGMATTKDKLTPIKWPVLGVFGDQDQVIPVAKVKEFETSLNALGVSNEIYIYPGVGHAFANPSNPDHAPTETEDAWQKTVSFLNKNLK